VEVIRTGARFFDKLTQVADVEAEIRSLDSEALKMVSDFLETMPTSGVPGLISTLVMAEKIRRFDNSIDFGKKFEAVAVVGGTFAEGFEAAHRGEEI